MDQLTPDRPTREEIADFVRLANEANERAERAIRLMLSAQSESRRLREALEALVKKLDEVDASASLKSVFLLAHIHGLDYTGPKYDQEVIAARAALAGGKEQG